MKALLAGAIAIVIFTSVVPIGPAADGAPTLLAQRSRGRGGGRGSGAVARSLIRCRVGSVDTVTGRVALDVDGTILEPTLPPERASEMKPGDVVFITVNLIDTRLAVVMGSVTAVDPQKGTLIVATPGGSLTVNSTVTTIQPGDTVILKLDVVDIGTPFGPLAPPTVGRPPSDPMR